ncbi:glycoside hydrolase family 3 protein [Labrenzia sp. VG12]|uniref:glycoside hydrolase family 3 protein n=1 Tax=Labrenzia sp. VG12 TaxID=2021862 RepID=UPI000B8C29BB|nr:glycoside hydrolase family 3 N-terminal domain-containing protein [Labrenzia sp. VG12]ASP34310.1 glycosyl hydrolase [Labrenzia sp. VG12]
MRFPRLFAAFLTVLTAIGGLGTARAEATDTRTGLAADEAIALETKIGQMILVGFLGNRPGHSGFKRVLAQMEAGQIGGVLYLGRNLKDRDTVRQMNAALSEAAASNTPPLIAIDQEGGIVQRLKRHHGFPQTVSAKRMARRSSPDEAQVAYGVLAEGLADWGFTLNLGPVVDVDVNRRNPIIGRLGRSYSRDPGKVAEFGAAFVEAHRGHRVLTALKHFPGHGSSRRDSHKGAVDVSRTWSDKELIPFQQLIDAGKVDLIMTAHVINRGLQGKGKKRVPVSLSETALTGTLRGDLGFTGVIITDDLQMDAIRRTYSLETAVLRAVKAGTDILLFANDKRPDPEIPSKVAKILLDAAKDDPQLVNKINAAYERIVTLKDGLVKPAFQGPSTVQEIETWLSGRAPDPDNCTLSVVQ